MTPARPTRTFPLLAWLVIAALVTLVVWRNSLAGPKLSQVGDEFGLILQGRMLVGMKQLNLPNKSAKDTIDGLQTGPYRQRLLATILVSEFDGAEAGAEALQKLELLRSENEKPYEPTEAEGRLRDALEHLHAGHALDDDGRAALDRLGWLGRLARTQPADAPESERAAVRSEAGRSTMCVLGLVLFGFALALVGGLILVVVVYLVRRGRFPWTFQPSPGGGLYAEAFAVYFAGFVGLGFVSRWIPGFDPLYAGGLLSLVSVALGLLWTLARGRDLATVRRDLGLHSGQGVGREILAGLATWCASLPLLLLMVMILTAVMGGANPAGGGDPFSPSSRPSHPVAGMIFGSVWVLIGLYWAAVIVAPVVEEIAFRGFLQTHLRGGMGRLTSAVLVGLVFAIIHPQGIVGVPALMMLAIVFSMAREWRGSLIAPMVAHGLNNGSVITLLIIAAR